MDRPRPGGRRLALVLRVVAVVGLALLVGCSNAEQVTVPNLHEKSIVEAYAQLQELGLKVAIDGPIRVGSNSTSWIGGHAPEAGNDVDVGSVVTLHPTPFPMGSIFAVDQPDPVVLPDLIGLRVDVTTRKLDKLRLLWSIESMPPLPASDVPTLLTSTAVEAMPRRSGHSASG